jgi:4-alpha-glucanotransferase
LPLGPTGYGNSPYQCLSAFAGNPLLISLDALIEPGLLTSAEARGQHAFGDGDVEFPAVSAHRESLWPRVLERFDAGAPATRDRFERFCSTNAGWLDDFALFMAVKAAHGQVAWTKLTQFLFFEQWQRVRDACRARGAPLKNV